MAQSHSRVPSIAASPALGVAENLSEHRSLLSEEWCGGAHLVGLADLLFAGIADVRLRARSALYRSTACSNTHAICQSRTGLAYREGVVLHSGER
jgi:hypothetical protein